MYKRILVPTDGSDCSDLAVAHGVEVARAMGATVVFLFAMDTLRAYHEGTVSMVEALEILTAKGKVLLDRAEKVAADAGVYATGELAEGTPSEVITGRASDVDLVVMGSHGMGLLKRLTGSVTLAVLHRITRPLLIVRCAPEKLSRS